MANNSIIRYSSLPPAHATVLQALETRPQQYFSNLAISTPTSMITADSPCLWEMRKFMGAVKTKAFLIYALLWLSDLINVERFLTEVQMSEIADDVIEEYGYLKPEELKYIFKKAVRKNKIFGRLDYAVVMSWIEDYDAERTGYCINISSQEETEQINRTSKKQDAVSFEEFTEWLTCKAESGDKEAQEQLAYIESISAQPALPTAEEKHKKDLEFFKWKNQVYRNMKK